MNKFFKDAMNKVQDFVAHPHVETATKVATGVLAVAGQIATAKLGGPLAIAGAVMGTMDVIQQHMGLEKFDPLSDWLQKNPQLRHKNTNMLKTLASSGAFRFLPIEVAATTETRSMVTITNGGKTLAFLQYGKTGEKDMKYDDNWFIEDGFDLSIIRKAMWAALDAPIVKMMQADDGGYPTLMPSGYDDVPYLGRNSPKKFDEAVEKFRSQGISRAYLLEGPPGTGKTSFVRAYARFTEQTLLVMPPDFLSGSSRQSAERLVRLLEPDVLLIDDIDRGTNGLSFAMTMVDDVRRAFPRMVMVSTVNQITNTNAALLRPGRLGKRLRFLAPPADEKGPLLRLYMKRYGVDETKHNVDELVARMTHASFSHDYVRFVAEEAVALCQEDLLCSIDEMNDLLDISGRMEPSIEREMPPSAVPGMPTPPPRQTIVSKIALGKK